MIFQRCSGPTKPLLDQQLEKLYSRWPTDMKPWLVELRVGSLRSDNFDVEQNMILQQRELDFLKEKLRDSQLQVTTYQRCTTGTST